MDFDQITFENSFTNVTFCHCCVWENWDWMWEIVVLDYFDVGDSTAGFFAVGDFGTGLFCCGRFYCWTFLLWEILMLDFLASGQMNRQAKWPPEVTLIQIEHFCNVVLHPQVQLN